jgi:hypothetical protein
MKWAGRNFRPFSFRQVRSAMKPKLHKDIIALIVIVVTLLILFIIF